MSRSVVTHRRRRRRILQELIDDVNTYTLNESVNSCELVSSDQSVNSEQESTVPQLTLENYACGRPLSHEQCKEGKTQQNSETRVFLRVHPFLSIGVQCPLWPRGKREMVFRGLPRACWEFFYGKRSFSVTTPCARPTRVNTERLAERETLLHRLGSKLNRIV